MTKRTGGSRRRWTEEEDRILTTSIQRHGCKRGSVTNSKWNEVSRLLPGRSNKDCRKRWFHSLDPTIRKGRWSDAEDLILTNAYARLGPAWKEIAALIPGRKDDQCAKRYTDILDPSNKDRLVDWTSEEDRLLTSLVGEFGHGWAKISGSLPGRPPLTCRNRWRALQKKSVPSRVDKTVDSPDNSSNLPTIFHTQDLVDRAQEYEDSVASWMGCDSSSDSTTRPRQSVWNGAPSSLSQQIPDWLSFDWQPPSATQYPSSTIDEYHELTTTENLGLQSGESNANLETIQPHSALGPTSFISPPQNPAKGTDYPLMEVENSSRNWQVSPQDNPWSIDDSESWTSHAVSRSGDVSSGASLTNTVHVVYHHHVYHHHVHHTSC